MPGVVKTVGRYELLRELGHGGMATVYLARQSDLLRFVALKRMSGAEHADPSLARRFIRESRMAGSLSHANIVTVHEYFEHEGTAYIAMEYVERGSLRPYIGQMTPAQMAGVLEGLLAGLTKAEQSGIVHRDLKPENLMVTSDGRVKIADFGIAKARKLVTTSALTATGATLGTPAYMAPEQAMAQEVGPWTDLYSVGCMAFEFVTGHPPFHDTEAPMAILLRHINEAVPDLRSVDPEVDPAIADWVARLVVKDPRQRTQSAGEAWDDLEEIVIGMLGPRWRRGARLGELVSDGAPDRPLTPAPFEAAQPGSEEFESFSWGQPAQPPERTTESDLEDLVEAPPPAPAEPPPAAEAPPPPPPEEPTQVQEPRPAPEAERRPTPAAQPRRRIWPAVGVVVLAVALGGLLFALQQPGDADPPSGGGGGGGGDGRTWTAPAYSVALPAGWARVCKDTVRCQNVSSEAGVRRSAFTKGTGEEQQRLTVDRTPGASAATVGSGAAAVEAHFRGLDGFRRDRTVPESNRLGAHRVRQFAFTSREPGSRAGVASVLRMGGDLYVITGTGSEVASVRRVVDSATASLKRS